MTPESTTDDRAKDIATERRKGEHIKIVAEEGVQATCNYWDDVQLVHDSLPELDYEDIDLSLRLFGKKLAGPLIISSMTGGFERAELINRNLAEAAAEVGVGMGVGSQRAALENPKLAYTYEVVREFDVPLVIGNIGAPQLIAQRKREPLSLEAIDRAVEMVDADVVAIHLNYLQEVVQPEGDKRASGVLSAIAKIAKRHPVLAKETGAGISKSVALRLKRAGVAGIDIGGAGGTSWSAVEHFRAKAAKDPVRERLGRTFWNWGIPSPVSVVLANVGLPIIATGGIRDGLDIARALALGATTGGIAHRILPAALESAEMVHQELTMILEEVKAALFLAAAPDLATFRSRHAIVTGRSRDWLDHLT